MARKALLGGLATVVAVATMLVPVTPAQATPTPVPVALAFTTTADHVHVRDLPIATRSAILATLGPAGTWVVLTCYSQGQSVFGDQIWYHAVAPVAGYVAGFYLNSGADPAAGVARCPAVPL